MSPWSSLTGGINLTSKDPRWVGAWWLGFLISAGMVALAASPYFFFPREMPKEKHELSFRRKVLAGAGSPVSKVSPSVPVAAQAPPSTYVSSSTALNVIPLGPWVSSLPRSLLSGRLPSPHSECHQLLPWLRSSGARAGSDLPRREHCVRARPA